MKMKKYCSFDEYFADQSPKNIAHVREARRARTPGSSEVGQRLLCDGERTGRLRLLGLGLRPVWLLPRLWLEGSAADPRRAVCAAYQGAQRLRHQRGRVQGALTASGALTLVCFTRMIAIYLTMR